MDDAKNQCQGAGPDEKTYKCEKAQIREFWELEIRSRKDRKPTQSGLA